MLDATHVQVQSLVLAGHEGNSVLPFAAVRHIGTVDDLEFDEENGQITALLVPRSGLIGIGGSHESIPASAIRAVGPQLITIDTVTPGIDKGKTTEAVRSNRSEGKIART